MFSFSFYDIFFVSSVIQTSCFFFLEKAADLYEQSSRHVSSASVLIETPAFHSYFDIYIYKLTDLLTDFITCLLDP